MKQQGKSITPGNADEFLTSTTAAAAANGQMQFFTPAHIAAAAVIPLSRHHALIYDPQCGDNALLSAYEARSLTQQHRSTHFIGTDIDARVKTPRMENPNAPTKNVWSCHKQININAFLPYLEETGTTFSLITANPPFSLSWPVAPLISAIHSNEFLPHDPGGLADFIAWLATHTHKGNIDSTLWTMIFSVLFQHPTMGESLIICNGNTARRFLFNEDGSPTPLGHYCWLQFDIDAIVFAGIQTAFPTALCYFSTSHRSYKNGTSTPHHVTVQTADSGELTRHLESIADTSYRYNSGRAPSHYNNTDPQEMFARFNSCLQEQKLTLSGKQNAHNISLDPSGKISVHLSTYATLKFSRTQYDALLALNKLRQRHPATLVVQAPTRKALDYAVTSGIWTVHPDVTAAVEKAIAEYNAVRAPFYQLSPVQSLGYLDEEDSIRCIRSLPPHFTAGESYTLNTHTEKIETAGTKVNLAGEAEILTLHSQELVICIYGDNGKVTFHVNTPADPENDDVRTAYGAQILVDHFHIPVPQDIATTNPTLHDTITRKLERIQNHINQL